MRRSRRAELRNYIVRLCADRLHFLFSLRDRIAIKPEIQEHVQRNTTRHTKGDRHLSITANSKRGSNKPGLVLPEKLGIEQAGNALEQSPPHSGMLHSVSPGSQILRLKPEGQAASATRSGQTKKHRHARPRGSSSAPRP